MIAYRKSVNVSLSKTGQLDDAKLQTALEDGKKHGSLNVVVTLSEDSKEYVLTGDARAVTIDDIYNTDDLSAVDDQLAKDLGTIGAVAKADPVCADYKSGEPVCLAYVLNHGGLPLAYGDAIKQTFAKQGERVSQDELAAAYKWCAVNGKIDLIAAGDKAGVLAAYRAAGSPK